MQDLATWLEGLSLGRYAGLFEENAIGADVIADLTDQDLKDLGLPLGDRKRLLKAITALTATGPATAPEARPAPITQSNAAPSDRRLVTVLFADLCGFTALSESFDAEVIRALQDDLHRVMADVVNAFGGFLEKFIGDACLAIFGAPVAHEDDPERALRAALVIKERVGALNATWQERLGRPLAMHVGAMTGPVVAGALGADADRAYAVTGDTVNTAARLLSAGGDGDILVGPPTHRLTQHLFSFEPIGEIEVKGKAQPVATYRLLGRRRAAESARGLGAFGMAAPMVGRADQLGQLIDAFEQAGRGRVQVARILGEAGAGKTRLLQEFVAALEAQHRLSGVALRRALCSPLVNQTYGLLADLVRDGYGIEADDDRDSTVTKLRAGFRGIGVDQDEADLMVSFLGYVLGFERRDQGLGSLEPEQLKRQIYAAARFMFEYRLRDSPVVIAIEDLHWSDDASVDVLRYMIDCFHDRPLMVVITQRPDFDLDPLAGDNAAQVVIRLAPLSEQDSGTLLDGLIGSGPTALPAGLRRQVIERAGGNPFFLEELIRGLVEGKVLHRDGAGWRCDRDAEMGDVPLTVQGLLLARFDRLPGDARRLAQEASVLGPTFSTALLRATATFPERMAANLAVLRAAELIEVAGAYTLARPGDEAWYRFTHAVVQEVLYENLLLSRRGELHHAAGEAIERACRGQPDRVEDLESLAHHFGRSSEKAKGVRYMIAAGDWAQRIFATSDALRHYRRALATIDQSGHAADQRDAVVERLADVLAPVGERDQALRHYQAALAAAVGRNADQARLCRKIAGLHWEAGARGLAHDCLDRALALLPEADDPVEHAHLCHELGRLAFRSGDNDQAIVWAERALVGARRALGAAAAVDGKHALAAPAAMVVAQSHNTIGVARARQGDRRGAVEQVENSLAIAEAHGLQTVICRAYTNLSVLYSQLDPGRAIEVCQRGIQVAKKIGHLSYQSHLYANLGVSYCTFTGRCDGDGLQAIRMAIELDRRCGMLDHLPVSLIALGQIYQCHGQPSLALQFYQEALPLAESLDEPQILFPCYDGLATAHLDIDDLAKAEMFMEKARALCQKAGLDPDSMIVLPFLC